MQTLQGTGRLRNINWQDTKYTAYVSISPVTVNTFEMGGGQIDASELTAKLPKKRDRWYCILPENRLST